MNVSKRTIVPIVVTVMALTALFVAVRLEGPEKKREDNSDSGRQKIATTNSTTHQPIESISTVIKKDHLTLGVTMTKSRYKTGEPIHGEYVMKYDGPPFEGLVLYTKKYSGDEQYFYSWSRNTVDTIDFSQPGQTNALKESLQTFGTNVPEGYFFASGIYTYTISVYDCREIERALESGQCGGDGLDVGGKVAAQVTPLHSVSQPVVIE